MELYPLPLEQPVIEWLNGTPAGSAGFQARLSLLTQGDVKVAGAAAQAPFR